MTEVLAQSRSRSSLRPAASLPRVGVDCRCFQDYSARRGVGRYVRGMLEGIRACAPQQLSIHLLLEEAPSLDEERPETAADGTYLGFPVHDTRLEVHKLPWIRRSRTLKRSLRALDIALYHVPAQFYLFHHLRVRVPYVVSVMDLIPFRMPEVLNYDKRRRFRRRLTRLRAACRRARGIIAISDQTRDDCVELLGIDPARIDVIPLGVDPQFNAQDRGDAAVLQRLGLSGPYFLYVGGQEGQKNFDGLLDAFGVYRQQHAGRAVLAVAGKRPKDPRFDPDRPAVRYLDFVAEEDLPALYRQAAAFVTLSTYEGFCLPVAEAMACGTPVVASNTTVFPQVVGAAGMLVDPLDAAAAAAALQRVESDADLARSLAERGVAKAADYQWRKVGAGTLAVYERALRGRG